MTQPHGRMAKRDRYIDIKTLLATETPVIIDGGANDRSTIAHLLPHDQAPAIHACAPKGSGCSISMNCGAAQKAS